MLDARDIWLLHSYSILFARLLTDAWPAFHFGGDNPDGEWYVWAWGCFFLQKCYILCIFMRNRELQSS